MAGNESYLALMTWIDFDLSPTSEAYKHNGESNSS